MTTSIAAQRSMFRQRLREYGIRHTELPSDRDGKLYVFPKESGYGIPPDCYEGLDVRLVETCGMDGMDEDHRLYRDYADHVLIFKICDQNE